MAYERRFMEAACYAASTGIRNRSGGPFGAVIVKNGEIICVNHNNVVGGLDPTAHGEIEAIRMACFLLKTYNLEGCDLYTTSEPCLMCLAACHWAHIENVYYGCTVEDAAVIGFDDRHIDDTLHVDRSDEYSNLLHRHDRDMCLKVFQEYQAMEHEHY